MAETDTPDEELLTTNEVAEQLRYTPKAVRELCERGSFPGAFQPTPGGPWRIPACDVAALRARTRAGVVRRRKGEQ